MKLNEIFDRIGELIRARKNKKGGFLKIDIAKALGVNSQDISNWQFRNKFPWEELFLFSQKHKISYDWLLTGTATHKWPALNVIKTSQAEDLGMTKKNVPDTFFPVPLLKDSVAAGSPQSINEADVDQWVLTPRGWMSHPPENYTCCRVKGVSMQPILYNGYIVGIDHAARDPRALDKKMVAFRTRDGGATIKWLKLIEKGLIVGVPENKADLNSISILQGEDEIETGIVGLVEWWWAKR